MSLTADHSTEDVTDLQLQDFIDKEYSKQQFQNLTNNLTDICWDTCIDHPSPRLASKEEQCLVNCVDRFIDASNYIVNRLERIALKRNFQMNME